MPGGGPCRRVRRLSLARESRSGTCRRPFHEGPSWVRNRRLRNWGSASPPRRRATSTCACAAATCSSRQATSATSRASWGRASPSSRTTRWPGTAPSRSLSVRQAHGTLDGLRVLKLLGCVNSAPDFTDQHLVINGASDLLHQLFGKDD